MATANDTRLPSAKTRQRAFRSAIRDVATAVTMLEQANADLERDKTPLDRETEGKLEAVHKRLGDLAGDARLEGVTYDEDDDATPIPESLARRAAALGYMLFNDDSGGITIEKIGEPDAGGLLGGSLTEANGWFAEIEAGSQRDVETDTAEVLAGQRDAKVDVAEAVLCIKTAERFNEVCAAAVEGIHTDSTHQISLTMTTELWTALQDALVALGDKVVNKGGIYTDADAAEGDAS